MSDVLRQVTMRRPRVGADLHDQQDTCWIPTELAAVGMKVRSREDGQVWTITAVYGAKPRALLESLEQTRRAFADALDPH